MVAVKAGSVREREHRIFLFFIFAFLLSFFCFLIIIIIKKKLIKIIKKEPS